MAIVSCRVIGDKSPSYFKVSAASKNAEMLIAGCSDLCGMEIIKSKPLPMDGSRVYLSEIGGDEVRSVALIAIADPGKCTITLDEY